MNNQPLILVFIIVVFIFGGLLYLYNPEPVEYKNPDIIEPEPVACTMEAKLCPDGSYVSRVPPDCEFEECPQTATSTPEQNDD